MLPPYFVHESGNWHLKEGAPEEVVKEFQSYMEALKISELRNRNRKPIFKPIEIDYGKLEVIKKQVLQEAETYMRDNGCSLEEAIRLLQLDDENVNID